MSGGVRAMFKMDDWDALLEDIKFQEANCQTFFDSVKDQEALDAREEGHRHRTSLLLGKLEELNLGIKGIRNKIEEIHFSDESKCFETLRTSNYLARKDLNPERLPGTCKWFLDHPKYLGWIAQNLVSRLLWVSADPGCGKSVLAKALVDQYDCGSVCYCFFKDDTTVTRSTAHAICAILHQVCSLRPALIKYILPVYRRNGGKLVDLFEDLWSAFNDMTNDKEFGNVICIFDAVDECSDDDSKKLLPRLAAITRSSNSIKILITSRPYISIENALFHKTGLDKNEIRLSGEARTEQSIIEKKIGFFITSRVQDFRKLRESREIYDDAHKKLQIHLDGIRNRTYLWVSAVFSELERDVYAPEYILMKTIKALPENVDKAYENILEKSPANRKLILQRVLHVMLVAFRPISLMEMYVVLSIQDTSSGPKNSDLYTEKSFHTWLRDLCGFFVNIVDNDIYFAHQTAREFLIGEDGYRPAVGWKGSFQLAYSHTLLAQICIDYLLLLYDGSLDAAFQDYATMYWPGHYQSFEEDRSLADKVKEFLFQNGGVAPSFVRWTTTWVDMTQNVDKREWLTHNVDLHHDIFHSITSPPTPLFLACYLGWPSIILVLKTFPDIDWNKKTSTRETSLQIAANKGHVEIVKLLLNAGAGVNIENFFGETALHYAPSQGNLETLKLLLDAKADISIQGRYEQTALDTAAAKGYLEIVKLLLNARADVNIRDRWQNTPLHQAVSQGHVEVVKLLLSARANVNIQDSGGETPSYRAAEKGNLEIAKLLCTAGADANVPSFPPLPLHQAVSRGNFEIVKLLVSAGVEIDIKNHRGNTPLYYAASQGNLEIVKLLLTAGADANMPSSSGTALHIARKLNYVEIAETLLAAGAIDS
ncbi:hypothetical protein MMC22_002417 [Lobaria immixta]|nr:hypothetical protein [Lobaria immixta]